MQWGLNRLSLRKLRELRERLVKCAPLVSASVLELRKFKLDQLPPSLRGLALIAIRKAEAAQKQFAEDIDSLLRNFARSELIDPDPDVGERAEERAAELEKLKVIFPGTWRGPRKKSRYPKIRKMRDPDALPYWPRGLSRVQAARSVK
jgi:hypothetical protein